ncbi:MAG: protein translocase SEC61 complex subunit gamma [Candidatus Micrarchaeota archaeon]|nr:protein translocase SEC61 complex subunit gamma [Candidatus Micrarchaeota archaeon]
MEFNNTVFQPVLNFTEQSKRVLNVTHKPQDVEFRQMAITTGIGLALIGVIGFILSMVAHYLRLL